MRVRLEKDGETVGLDGPALARGGEAAIHPVPGRLGLLAKVYHQPTAEHADKLIAMIAAPPADPTAAQGHTSIAWPTDRLLDPDGRCVGFVMRRVDRVQSLFDVYNPKSRLQTWPLFHYGYLLRTARNLATAVRALHARGYVVGDLNESNVLVNGQTLVTVVDTDSFQVRADGRVFRCTVGKPEYVAPEIQGVDFAGVDRTAEHDAFALAVLIFQLLMQGAHPFLGRFTGTGEPEVLARRIAAGHWPYAKTRTGPYAPNPTAPPFAVLPPQVGELMRLCFEEGHDHPSARPDACRWQKALAEADGELVECPANGQHRFHKSLDSCPWCELAVRQGRDPFPSKEAVLGRADASGAHKAAATVVTVLESKPTTAVHATPPAAPKSNPSLKAPRKRSARRRRLIVLPPYLATPWPWVIGAGVTALAVLVWLIVSNARRPAAPPVLPTATAAKDSKDAPDVSQTGRKDAGSGATSHGEGPDEPVEAHRDEIIGDRRHFEGHTDRVSSVALSRIGNRALSGGWDGWLRLWDVESGKEKLSLRADPDRVLSVAISPDGRLGLSGGWNHDVRLWDLESGAEVHTFKGHTDYVRSVTFSPDGKRALSGGDDKTVHLWDVDARGEIYTFNVFDSGVTSVAFSPDGDLAAAGCLDGTVWVWDLASLQPARAFVGHKGPVHSVAFAPTGGNLLSCGEDWSIRLWNLQTRGVVKQFSGHLDAVRCAAFTPDGRGVLSCGDGGTVRFWNAEDGKEVCHFETGGHVPLTSVAFGAVGWRAVSGGGDNLVRLWSLPDPKTPPDQRADHPPQPMPLPDKGTANPYAPDAAKSDSLLRSFEHADAVSCVAFLPGGGGVVTGCADGQVRVWDVNSGEARDLHAFPEGGIPAVPADDNSPFTKPGETPIGGVLSVAVSPDGAYVAAGGSDRVVRLWQLKDGKVRVCYGHAGAVLRVAFVNGGAILLAGDELGQFLSRYGRMGPQTDDKVARTYNGAMVDPPACIALLPNGKQAVLAGPNLALSLWDLRGAKILHSFEARVDDSVYSIALSADGARAVTTGADGAVRSWDVQTGKEEQSFEGHKGDVWCAAISPSGDRLLTGGDDGTVSLWDMKTGKEVHSFTGHTAAVRGVAFSPDGTRAVSAGDDKTARVWQLPK